MNPARPRPRSWPPAAFLATGLAVLIAISIYRNHSTPGELIPVAERKPAGDIEWPLPDGTTCRLSDYKGKVVLINYFATWCPPCVREMPGIVSAVNDLGPKGVPALAVSLDKEPGKVPPFVQQYK